MTCGIYMIQNKVNNKIYIGQAVDIKERWGDHRYYLRGNRNKPNKHLQNAWNKYGEDNFEFTIICKCDESQLNTFEQYYIFELMAYDNRVGYNKNYGGGSGRPTEETRKKLIENNGSRRPEVRKKMSESKRGENNNNYGKHHSEETRKKISEALKGKQAGENNYWYGKHLPEEVKKKISESHKGKTLSEEHRKKLSEAFKGENHPMYGKHHTEESRRKNSEAHKGENHPNYGKHLPEETRKKIGEANRGENNPNSIPVAQLTLDNELVNVYSSAGEAKRSGFDKGHVNSCCRGKTKTHKGYKWMYLSDYEAMKKEG